MKYKLYLTMTALAGLLTACGGSGSNHSNTEADQAQNIPIPIQPNVPVEPVPNTPIEPVPNTPTEPVPNTPTEPVSNVPTEPIPPNDSNIYTTIEKVVNDMSLPSEALPINPIYNWQYNPVITQYAPRGDAIPDWWTGNRPTWCYGAISWFTVYEAENNTASNSRVQIKNLRMYFLSEKTRQWTRVDMSEAPRMDLWKYPFDFSSSNTGERAEATGGKSIKPVYPEFHHGYGNSYSIPEPQDIRATFVAMDFKLILDNAQLPDDRDNAKYVVDTGGDYYPGGTTGWSLNYAPGMGNGRYLLAEKNWKTATMIVPNKNYGATMEEFKNNPPPLN